jgi:hypothetical protein
MRFPRANLFGPRREGLEILEDALIEDRDEIADWLETLAKSGRSRVGRSRRVPRERESKA